MINLSKFSARADIREYLRQPFRCSEGIVASNGHILVCVADDGGNHPDGPKTMDPPVSKFRMNTGEPGREWFDMSAITLPDREPCTYCGGSGYEHQEDCEDCDGEGEFEHGLHSYDCKACRGTGKVDATPGQGEKVACYRCDGSGESQQTVRVGKALLQRRYLARIAELPSARIGTAGSLETVVFTFDGGFGAVMPVRT